jgi:hypothetical protein
MEYLLLLDDVAYLSINLFRYWKVTASIPQASMIQQHT